MSFSPSNPIVKRCMEGMQMEEKGFIEKAEKLFSLAWNEAGSDFEKFLAAYYIARSQKTVAEKLHWLEQALQHALTSKDAAATSALPTLYRGIAQCQEELGETQKSKQHFELAALAQNTPADAGPFYHGTKAQLEPGDLLTPGGSSNYQQDLTMNHIYFTALINGAGLAAELAKGNQAPRVYIIEPTGSFENDPNVTDKKFPGNPTRSYRSPEPLKITGEVTDWVRLTPEELQQWQQRLAASAGKIIN